MLSLLTTDFFISSLFYVLIGILGSFSKEIYSIKIINSNKKKQISKEKIFLGAILNFIIMPSLEVYIKSKVPIQVLLIFSYLIGVLNVELFDSISTISKLTSTIYDIKNLKVNIAREAKKEKEELPKD